MNSLVKSTIAAIGVAGDLGGIPYLSTASTLLEGIRKTCEQVAIHKAQCKQLASKAAQLISVLDENASRLEGSDLRSIVDEVENTLRDIHTRVTKWSQLNRLEAWCKSGNIEKGLKKSDAALDIVITKFSMTANIVADRHHQDIAAQLNNNQEELREMFLEFMRSPRDIRDAAAMQKAGEPVAVRMMEQGQLELRQLREQHPIDDNAMDVDGSSQERSARSQQYQEVEHGLAQLQRLADIPPTLKILNGEVQKEGEIPLVGGTYSDIWLGTWLGSRKVALKALRNIRSSSQRAEKRFAQEISVWAKLEHPNILPFYGIVTNIGYYIYTVSPWQDNGNILEYVKAHPDAERLPLLSGAAEGLEYLHIQQVIHGNVRCSNILVSSELKACICDFGMAKVTEDITEVSASATLTKAGSSRWLAPEFMLGTISSPTMATDTYAFAMAMLECFTGEKPYAGLKRDAQVIRMVCDHKTPPSRPDNPEAQRFLTDDLWDLMKRCWSYEPNERPVMSDVAATMHIQDPSIV